MIRIKVEVEEQETGPLPIESKNVGSPNDNNVVTKKQTEKNVVVAAKVPNKVVPLKKPKLENSSTDSVAAFDLSSIKTEPAESSLSLTTQLNQSVNIQSLLRQNRIQNGWTTNEQSIPIGTQQQQQQSAFLPKIERIVPEIKKNPFLKQSFCILNLYPNSMETTTTTTTTTTTDNCDSKEIFSGPRAGPGLRAEFNKVPKKEPIPVSIRGKKVPEPSPSPSSLLADNLELASNDNDQDSCSGSGIDPSPASSTTEEVAAPAPPKAPRIWVNGRKPYSRLPLLTAEEREEHKRERRRQYNIRKKANSKSLPLVPSSTLEERKEGHREKCLDRYYQQKENPEIDPEVRDEKRRQANEYNRKWREQRLKKATPKQLQQIRLKRLEYDRRQLKNESEEQREKRLERSRKYNQTVGKERRKQWLASATLEQLKQMRMKQLKSSRRYGDKESEERREQRLERLRQYNKTMYKRKKEMENNDDAGSEGK